MKSFKLAVNVHVRTVFQLCALVLPYALAKKNVFFSVTINISSCISVAHQLVFGKRGFTPRPI